MLTEGDLVELRKTASNARLAVQKVYPGLDFAPCIFDTKVDASGEINWD